MFSWAVDVERKGFQPLPLASRSKVPQRGFDLNDHFQRDVPVEEDCRWYRHGANVALKTGRLLVADYDDKAKAREFYKRMKGLLKTVSETRRGAHFLFQAPSPDFPTGEFEDGDLKATGGFIVFPHSTVIEKDEPWTYRFVDGHPLVPFDELPVFEPDMVKMRVKGKSALTRDEIRNAIAYVMKVESVDGKSSLSRDNGLIRAIAILRDSGMTESEATVVMIDWNRSGKAVPPWPIRDLTRAISRTFQKGR